MTRTGILLVLFILCAAVSLAACSPTTPSPSAIAALDTATEVPASDTPAPTLTFTPQPPTATATLEPTATLSPTVTFTPTISPTPTLTPTPTQVMVQPGFYNTGGCSVTKPTIAGTDEINYEFCVVNVEVNLDQHMIFNISWKVSNLDEGNGYLKASEQGNTKIYLVDNLGNRYNHLSGGGGAYSNELLKNNQLVTGWLEFEKVKLGAVTFSFYDESQDFVIQGIPMMFPTVIFDVWRLRDFPLQLEYSTLKWAVNTMPDGNQGLIHQNIEGCSIQERSGGQPSGQLYNIGQAMGEATYGIYGAIDQAASSAYREYILLGASELIQAGQPTFLVSIPLDDSTVCVYDASDVLAKLSLRP